MEYHIEISVMQQGPCSLDSVLREAAVARDSMEPTDVEAAPVQAAGTL